MSVRSSSSSSSSASISSASEGPLETPDIKPSAATRSIHFHDPLLIDPAKWKKDKGPLPIPKPFKSFFDDPKAGIVIWNGCDYLYQLRARLDAELKCAGIRNTLFEEEEVIKKEYNIDIFVVLLTNLFTHGESCAYYVPGQKNIAKLMLGMSAQKGYQGAAFITITSIYTPRELFQITARCHFLETVSRDETKGIRFRYYYNTAVELYKKIEYEHTDFDELYERMMALVVTNEDEEEPSIWGDLFSSDEEEEEEENDKEDDEGDNEREEEEDGAQLGDPSDVGDSTGQQDSMEKRPVKRRRIEGPGRHASEKKEELEQSEANKEEEAPSHAEVEREEQAKGSERCATNEEEEKGEKMVAPAPRKRMNRDGCNTQ